MTELFDSLKKENIDRFLVINISLFKTQHAIPIHYCIIQQEAYHIAEIFIVFPH